MGILTRIFGGAALKWWVGASLAAVAAALFTAYSAVLVNWTTSATDWAWEKAFNQIELKRTETRGKVNVFVKDLDADLAAQEREIDAKW